MTPDDRALIVRALRAAADRVEAGAPVAAYSAGEVDGWAPAGHCVATARLRAEQAIPLELDEVDNVWGEHVEEVQWGVCVLVEAARIVTRRCAGSLAVDYWADYALVDPLTHVEPDEQPCDDDECGGR